MPVDGEHEIDRIGAERPDRRVDVVAQSAQGRRRREPIHHRALDRGDRLAALGAERGDLAGVPLGPVAAVKRRRRERLHERDRVEVIVDVLVRRR